MLNFIDPASLARPGNVGLGFVRLDMPEVADNNTPGFEGPDHAGVAFALITFGSPDGAMHTQTFIGHERG